MRSSSAMLPLFLIEGDTPHPSSSIVSRTHNNGSHSPEQVPSADSVFTQQAITQIDQGQDIIKKKGCCRLLFIAEPILNACLLFPILVLFWDCGWNLFVTMLNSLNDFPLTLHLYGDNNTSDEFGNYSPESLIIPYLIVETLLLVFYLGQEICFSFLKRQHFIVAMVLLKGHILILAIIYIVQWEMIWTILDQYTLNEWTSELLLSLTSLFALIVVTGHLSDLVCSPFLVCYDSIEYCVRFECPLLAPQMKGWKINVINCFFYEFIISNITIIVWHGFYSILDQYLYPDDQTQAAWICLLIGYPLFFPLMYFQNSWENFNVKCEFCKFFSSNFPQFWPNIYHGLAFTSCLFVWRGFWVLYDSYLTIFESNHQTYLLIFFISFTFLALIQTASSMNGPLNHIHDDNHFFSVYTHCYVSIVVRKVSRWSCFQSRSKTGNAKIMPFGD